MKVVKIIFGAILSLNSVFILIMLGHCISIYTYFHGPPPNKDYQMGHISLTVCLVAAMISCTLAFFLIQLDLKSLIVAVAVNVGFLVALILSAVVIYGFRDPQPTTDKFRDFTVDYYKENKKPPPFIDKLQRSMKGYCCGTSSYLDYVSDPNAEFFDVPHTCCFAHLRRTDPNCGKHRWKYLYMFLSSILTDAMSKLEKDYEDLEDLASVQRKLSRSKAQHFIDTHIRDMFNDRVNSIKKNLTSERYSQISKQEQDNNGNNLASSITNRIYEEAQASLVELKAEMLDLLNVSFVPMGCWALMDEIQRSNWRGFQRFNEIRQRVRAIFQGVLAMNIINLALLIMSTAAFNYHYYFAGNSLSVDEEATSKSVKLEDTDTEITVFSEKSHLLDDNEISTGVSETEKSEDMPPDAQLTQADEFEDRENRNLIDLKRNSRDGRRSSDSNGLKKLSRL